MLKSFNCPKCGAPVSYEQDVVGASLTARCSYCNSALSVPDEARGRPAALISNVNIDLGNAGASATKWIVILVLVPIVLIIIGVIAMGGFLMPMLSRVSPPPRGSSSTTPPKSVALGGKEKPRGFANETMKFGSEGIGPGMFSDARSIAVDGSGKIYVGEYSGGRVQVFDGEGKFITQWTVNPKMPLRALAADRAGTVYVVQSGKISKFEGATGKALGEVPFEGGWGFDDVKVAADGGLIAAWYQNRDDIVRLDRDGKVTRTIQSAISSVTDRSELDTRVTIDGLGNIYALGSFNDAVFKFGPDGKFATRFGSAGDQAGQFRAASAIAVDGKGRVYVSDIKGIQVFDSNGRYIATFSAGGIASGMVFNDKNELFIASRNHVVKMALDE